jgi:hypothetical protein
MGAEALQQLLKKMDLDLARSRTSATKIRIDPLQADQEEIARRMKIIQGFLASGKRPERHDPRRCSRSSRRTSVRWFRSKAAASPPPT